MSSAVWQDALRKLTGVAGVRGAMIVSVEDGLVVTETAMDDLETSDVAALAAAVVSRAVRCVGAMDGGALLSVHLTADLGAVLAVAGPEPLWLVAVARPDAEVGRLRLLLRDCAGALG